MKNITETKVITDDKIHVIKTKLEEYRLSLEQVTLPISRKLIFNSCDNSTEQV